MHIIGERQFVKLIEELFPRRNDYRMQTEIPTFEWREEWEIKRTELTEAIKANKRGKAPGPDSITRDILKLVPDTLILEMLSCYNDRLKRGKWPKKWKKAKIMLIPKNDWKLVKKEEKYKARPICLINDLAKTFERILNNRIINWMESNPGKNLSENQYGFRRSCSTVDALLKLKQIVKPLIENGGAAIGIGIDIENAFNSLPWPRIKEAMANKEFPLYIQKIIENYLKNRNRVQKSQGRKKKDYYASRGTTRVRSGPITMEHNIQRNIG